MNHLDCITCKNHSCIFRKSCSSEWLGKISTKKHCWSIQEEQAIFLEDMPAKGLYVVYEGAVTEYYQDRNNKTKVIHTAQNGDIFGHRDFSNTKHAFNARAATESHICFFDKETIYEMCRDVPELVFNLISFFGDELHNSYKRQITGIQVTDG